MRIGRGVLYLLGGKVGLFLVMACQVIWVPGVLGPENMGFYSYWLSIFFILGKAFDLGGHPILARYLPEYRATHPSAIRPLVWRVLGIKLPLFILVLVAGWIVLSETRSYFLIILLGAALLSMTSIVEAIFYGHQRMGLYGLLPVSRLFFRLILILLLFHLLGRIGILLAILGAPLLEAAIFAGASLRSLPQGQGPLPEPLEEYLIFGIGVYLAGLFLMLSRWMIIILSKHFIPDLSLIGYLGLGLQISLFINQFVSSISESVFPSLITFHTLGDPRFKRALELTWRYTNLMLFPLVAGMFILAKPAVRLVIGVEFLPAVGIVYVFLPAVVFLCWRFFHGRILFAFKKKRQIFLRSFLEFLILMISGWYLIKTQGVLGAPMAACLGALGSYAYSYAVSSRLEKISGYLKGVVKPLLASLLMSAVLSFIPITSVFHLLGGIFLGGILYFGIIWILGGAGPRDFARLKGLLDRPAL